MMRKAYFILFTTLLATTLLAMSWIFSTKPGSVSRVAKQENSRKCNFSDANHVVEGDILAFCETLPNPELLLGYPITDAFETPNGEVIQYFQRAVVKKTNTGVFPLNVGEIRWKYPDKTIARTPIAPPNLSINSCETINKHSVCNEFLTFYQRYGAYIGVPITDALWENGELVQYFVGARLVSRNEGVIPSEIGSWYFDRFEPNKSLLASSFQNAAPKRYLPLSQIRAKADVEKITTARGEEQVLYILVTDQNGQPVEGVKVTMHLTTTDNTPISISGGKYTAFTDNQGAAQIVFRAPYTIGRIIVHVTATYQDKQTTIQTTFRVWY